MPREFALVHFGLSVSKRDGLPVPPSWSLLSAKNRDEYSAWPEYRIEFLHRRGHETCFTVRTESRLVFSADWRGDLIFADGWISGAGTIFMYSRSSQSLVVNFTTRSPRKRPIQCWKLSPSKAIVVSRLPPFNSNHHRSSNVKRMRQSG